jgi:hypothetical protein
MSKRKLIKNWPVGAPDFLRHLSRRQLINALRESEKAEPMPDAELTPEMVFLRNMQREMESKGFEALAMRAAKEADSQ